MNQETIKQKLSVIISNENLSGNEKRDSILKLFGDEQFLNMQYYMEYCESHAYTTPQNWMEHIKHF